MTVIIKQINNGFIIALVNDKEQVEEIYVPDGDAVATEIASIFVDPRQQTVKEPPKIKEDDVPKPPESIKTDNNKKPLWVRPKGDTI